jgi:hypothetical protein
VELLGMLPEVKEKNIIITEKWKKSSRYQEDIYSLQNRVDYLMKRDGQKVLLVTSTDPSEGKTTVAVNLALAMANKFDPSVVPMIAQGAINAGVNAPMPINQQGEEAEMVQTDSHGNVKKDEHAFVKNARERAQSSTQPR